MSTDSAEPAAPASATPVSDNLRRWTAYQFAAGAIKGYRLNPQTGVVTVPVDTGRGVVEVDLVATDFADILRAPIGRWYTENAR